MGAIGSVKSLAVILLFWRILFAGVVDAGRPAYTVSGMVYFDQDGNGQYTTDDPAISGTQITIVGPSGAVVPPGGLRGDGTFSFLLTPGTYTLQARLVEDAFTSGMPGGLTILSAPPRTVTVTKTDVKGVDLGLLLPTALHDAHYFPQTGFRIDNDQIWNYFTARGGVNTIGYPVSRTFPFLGFWTQIFQREVVQVGGQGGATARPMNLLDSNLMPITSINFSTFPAYNPAIANQAPSPYTSNYGAAIGAFIRRRVPDIFDRQPVYFYRTFVDTVSLQAAYPDGDGSSTLLPLLNLEIWGVPTSVPTIDPNNHNFVYQRFQRGIMQYDAGCHCTQGILLADTFKRVLTGQGLPADIALEMAESPYLRLYDPTQVDGVARAVGTRSPRVAGWTDLTFAFVTGAS